MADIRLNVTGDSSGGVAAMDDMADAVGKSNVKWQEMANAAKMAAKAVVDFVKESVKQYAESERIQKQLTRVAGEYTDALSDQAEALSRLYAVDDDIIKQSETLLVQWGGVGAATKKTEKAILDYAAATGQDAVAATQDLIRNVESGGKGLAKMGVHFEVTGKKGADLASAVDALGKKFGGAAAADANSLTGQTNAAALAFADLQKAFGGMVSELVAKGGTITKITAAIRELTAELFTSSASKQAESREFLEQQAQVWRDHLSGKLVAYKDHQAGIVFSFEEAQQKLAAIEAKLNPQSLNSAFDGSKPNTVTGKTNAQMQAELAAAKEHAAQAQDIQEKNVENWRKSLKEMEAADDESRAKEREDYADELKMSADRVEVALKEAEKIVEIRRGMLLQVEEDNAKHAEKMAKDTARLQQKQDAEQKDNARKQAAEWERAADAIGAGFVNALSAQLEKLASGGEFDTAQFVGDILAITFAAAATAIGSANGAPALGAAIGNIGAIGIRAGAAAISADEKKAKRAANTKKYHDGGWVGAPRYHSGTWIGSDEERAILQTGERVLSRTEVGAMGGAHAIDKMAKGGSSRIVVNVSALDAKSAAEAFETETGKGLRRALRTGRGDLPAILGMGPR